MVMGNSVVEANNVLRIAQSAEKDVTTRSVITSAVISRCGAEHRNVSSLCSAPPPTSHDPNIAYLTNVR